jgi:hypothetical protein
MYLVFILLLAIRLTCALLRLLPLLNINSLCITPSLITQRTGLSLKQLLDCFIAVKEFNNRTKDLTIRNE